MIIEIGTPSSHNMTPRIDHSFPIWETKKAGSWPNTVCSRVTRPTRHEPTKREAIGKVPLALRELSGFRLLSASKSIGMFPVLRAGTTWASLDRLIVGREVRPSSASSLVSVLRNRSTCEA